jgi:hypothetical protein
MTVGGQVKKEEESKMASDSQDLKTYKVNEVYNRIINICLKT